MADVKKGGMTTATKRPERSSVKTTLRDRIASEDSGEKPVGYVSLAGADGAWVLPSKPIYGDRGQYLGMDDGVHLDFQGLGVTQGFYLSNPVHASLVERVDELIESNHPIVHELGLRRLEAEAPRPPFRKWDTTSRDALKITLKTILGDDAEENVKMLKECVRYESARDEPRDDVIAMLEAMAAGEAVEVEADVFAAGVAL